MDEKPDVIRHEIEETRSSLAEKLETLEGQVTDTISSVTESVEETVEKVKSTVSDTVDTVKSSVEDTFESVKRTFDLPYQVDQHPWAMAGCSLLAGMAVGYLTGGWRGYTRRWESRSVPAAPASVRGTPAMSGFGPGGGAGYQAASTPAVPPATRREPEEPGMLSRLMAPFASEIDKIKGTAVAALMGMVRDSLVRSVPPALAERVHEIMDDLTRRAGGQPIREPVLPTGSTPETGAGRTGSTPAL
jgi:ElaB/YqjD/DUF883 family membrane-anchored ribosome-binding protein